MDISPIILRMHPELDPEQQRVVGHGPGPMLAIAGPGSGKTLCVELRALNLLLTGQGGPGGIVLCTFGRDAARELQQRFTQSALRCGAQGHLSRVRISTIHGLCHRVLAPHARLAGLRPGYSVLDEVERFQLLCREFDVVLGPDWEVLSRRGWRSGRHGAAEAAKYFDRICDELIAPDVLAGSERPFTAALGRCLGRYRELLLSENAVDFAHLQVWAERVLQDDGIAARTSGTIGHLMVDEFQDTSRVQLRVLERLAKAHGNISVVGDDDQSIYRFRGASVASILEFPRRFPGCRTLGLTTNYRSHRDIVSACGQWMDSAAPWEAGGRAYRYAKSMAPHQPVAHSVYPAIISVQGRDPVDEASQLADLLRFLRNNGVIANYGQAALLLHSVKDAVSGPYLDGLERAGIPTRCEPAGQVRVPAGDEVLVTTIHQGKGLEWDLVVIGSLTGPDMATDRIGRNLTEFGVYSGEPESLVGEFDRARAHYVAFTRARRLLVLTASGEPQATFRSIWDEAARWPDVDRDVLARQRFGVAGAAPRRTVYIDSLDRLVVRVMPPR